MLDSPLATAARAAVAGFTLCLVATVAPAAGGAATRAASQDAPLQPVAAAASSGQGAVRVVARADAVIPSKKAFVVPTGARVRLTVSVAGAGAARRTVVLHAGPARAEAARTRTDRRGVARLAFVARRAGRTSYRVVVPGAGPARALAATPLTVVVRPREDPPRADGEPTTLPEGPSAADTVAEGLAYSFLDTGRPGSVFRWDPCSPVRYRVDLGDVSPTLVAAVSSAVQRLADATGLDLVEVGGSDDADLHVTVVNEGSDSMLAGATIGYARITRATWAPDGDARILSAEVLLEREYLTAAADRSDAGVAAVGALLAHELGHAVGLGHSGDSRQVMYPTLGAGSPVAYGAGDLGGLTRVGAAGGCLG